MHTWRMRVSKYVEEEQQQKRGRKKEQRGDRNRYMENKKQQVR